MGARGVSVAKAHQLDRRGPSLGCRAEGSPRPLWGHFPHLQERTHVHTWLECWGL